jgi:hypothetical protein
MDLPSYLPHENTRRVRSSKTGAIADSRLFFLVVSPLKNSPALQQTDDQNDHGDDQKNVNEAAGVEREKPQSPEDEQDDQDCPKHKSLLLSFCLSAFYALPFSDGAIDSRNATRINAIFMPNSFRILSRLRITAFRSRPVGRTN